MCGLRCSQSPARRQDALAGSPNKGLVLPAGTAETDCMSHSLIDSAGVTLRTAWNDHRGASLLGVPALALLCLSLVWATGSTAAQTASPPELSQPVAVPSTTYSPPANLDSAQSSTAAGHVASPPLAHVQLDDGAGARAYCKIARALAVMPEISGAIRGGGYLMAPATSFTLAMHAASLEAGLPQGPIGNALVPDVSAIAEHAKITGDFLTPADAQSIQEHSQNLVDLCNRSAIPVS